MGALCLVTHARTIVRAESSFEPPCVSCSRPVKLASEPHFYCSGCHRVVHNIGRKRCHEGCVEVPDNNVLVNFCRSCAIKEEAVYCKMSCEIRPRLAFDDDEVANNAEADALFCEGCLRWWHRFCVGTTEDLWAKMHDDDYGSYYCPTCVFVLYTEYLESAAPEPDPGPCRCGDVCGDAARFQLCAHCGTKEHWGCLGMVTAFKPEPFGVRQLVHLCSRCSKAAYSAIEEVKGKIEASCNK